MTFVRTVAVSLFWQNLTSSSALVTMTWRWAGSAGDGPTVLDALTILRVKHIKTKLKLPRTENINIQGSETWTHDTHWHCPIDASTVDLCQRWTEWAWQGGAQGSGGRWSVVCQCSAAQTTTTSQKCGPTRDLSRDDQDQWEDGYNGSLWVIAAQAHMFPGPLSVTICQALILSSKGSQFQCHV